MKKKTVEENIEVDNIRILRKEIEKRFGGETLGDGSCVRKLSSGILSLDKALGGGWPLGRIISINGWESSGKSTLALQSIVVPIQRLGKTVVYIDSEYALDPEYAVALGVDLDENKFILCQPDSAESAIEIIRTCLKNKQVGGIIVDSIAGLIPSAIEQGEAGDQKMGLKARLMSQWVPTFLAGVKKTDCILTFINQFRDKIGVLYGPSTTVDGGNAIKFYSSQILEVSRVGQVKEGDDVLSNRTRIKVIKNKVAKPYRRAEFQIAFGKGIDIESDIIDVAIEEGIIVQKGPMYYYGEESIARGIKNIPAWIEMNPDKKEEIKNKVLSICDEKESDQNEEQCIYGE